MRVAYGYYNGIVNVCKLVSTVEKVFRFTHGSADVLKLGIDEIIELGSLVGFSEGSKYVNIDGSIDGISLG